MKTYKLHGWHGDRSRANRRDEGNPAKGGYGLRPWTKRPMGAVIRERRRRNAAAKRARRRNRR